MTREQEDIYVVDWAGSELGEQRQGLIALRCSASLAETLLQERARASRTRGVPTPESGVARPPTERGVAGVPLPDALISIARWQWP